MKRKWNIKNRMYSLRRSLKEKRPMHIILEAVCIPVTYGHFHYAAATSGFDSVELIDKYCWGLCIWNRLQGSLFCLLQLGGERNCLRLKLWLIFVCHLLDKVSLSMNCAWSIIKFWRPSNPLESSGPTVNSFNHGYAMHPSLSWNASWKGDNGKLWFV